VHTQSSSVSITAEQLNDYFAKVSSDASYKPPLKKVTAETQTENEFIR